MEISKEDLQFMNRAIELGNEAETEGNMPFGAVVVLDGKIISEGKNQVFYPKLSPNLHAEINALSKINSDLILKRAKDMVLYANIEPCIMCFGTIILYHIGKVIYGGRDINKGPCYLIENLNKIYKENQLPKFIGPILDNKCTPMWKRANMIYSKYWDNTKPK
jgi:tRNA(adenine34) deaminase